MNIAGIPISEIIPVAVGIIGAIYGWLQRSDRLPVWARRWMKSIGRDEIVNAIEIAEKVADATPAERREMAVEYLQRLCENRLGFGIPTSVANLLVEFVYQQWKRRR